VLLLLLLLLLLGTTGMVMTVSLLFGSINSSVSSWFVHM
jgi:hypothetical protein